MIYSKTESDAEKIAAPVAKQYGYGIYDINYVKEGPHLFLRIFITGENGVDLDDCEAISREISKQLDDTGLIENNYFLEISSPGIERVLRQNEHFEGAVGENIRIKLFSPMEKVKELEGSLTAANDSSITVETESGVFEIDKKNIAKANVVFDFSSL